jgi:hypothetical protein
MSISRKTPAEIRERGRRRRKEMLPSSSFGFLDETGTLGGQRDPYFAVGLMCLPEPYELLRPLQRIRDKRQFYDEIKWNQVSAKRLPILEDLVRIFFHCDRATFSAFICDKSKHDVIGRFGGPFGAYEALARQLILGSLRKGDLLWVIADEYSTPPHVTFEENVRDWVNGRARKPGVAGVCRMRSVGNDLLQMIDLLLGAVVYEFKGAAGTVEMTPYKPKVKLLECVKEEAGVDTFLGGYRNDRLNVVEYGDQKARAMDPTVDARAA